MSTDLLEVLHVTCYTNPRSLCFIKIKTNEYKTLTRLHPHHDDNTHHRNTQTITTNVADKSTKTYFLTACVYIISQAVVLIRLCNCRFVRRAVGFAGSRQVSQRTQLLTGRRLQLRFLQPPNHKLLYTVETPRSKSLHKSQHEGDI